MSALSKLLVAIGLLSLFHAAYSAHEYSTLALKLHQQSSTANLASSLPLDIKLETLTSVFIACLGLVLGTQPLQPISWSKWAGDIERKGGGANPFRTLEDRIGFMDIRAKQKDFTEWAKTNAGAGSAIKS